MDDATTVNGIRHANFVWLIITLMMGNLALIADLYLPTIARSQRSPKIFLIALGIKFSEKIRVLFQQ